jgi:hypothetical protein
VTGSPKRLASRFHQLKTGHCLTGQYLQWRENRTTAKRGWCPPYKTQSWEHLACSRIACVGSRSRRSCRRRYGERETGRGKARFKIRDPFEDVLCTRPILDFLRATDVGRRMDPDGQGRRPGARTRNGMRERSRGRAQLSCLFLCSFLAFI